jgi:hypothetical protein
VGDDSHFVFRQKALGEDGNVKRGFVMVKQPGLFSPKFGATSSHVFMQSSQNVAVEPGIHSLACLNRCFALPQLLYRWRHQSGIVWIPPRIKEFVYAKFNHKHSKYYFINKSIFTQNAFQQQSFNLRMSFVYIKPSLYKTFV